ncbi:MAG: dihydrofolate reductase [Deltaproteobacteria bacterium]|jgi:dihydrofolate reductase|nr:dihydrofolate reductase [Deltaproteobacteria bacterium]MBT4269578.1 dihydrofolate reductase [Deltaproteobacteria bacterium]MBT4637820.1 dihydrofolate reductase [Deltaproteobacteria bacterium]MBT6499342.1 dihydrofolate reductase [Deltaproteobacteria bacterium]MBT6611193.1 dihydrofolate reductase [Deltaproteobacteria bacterium]
MTKIAVIVAVAQNGVIGRKNDIPWRLSEDFQHFKELTLGCPCIMGDITYESLPEKSRPLPGRENIVLTFDKTYHPDGTTIFYDFEDAIDYVRKTEIEIAYITGGSTVYKLGMEVADIFELTRIHKDIEGDIVYPDINWDEWELVKQEDHQGTDKISGETLDFSYLTYHRKN